MARNIIPHLFLVAALLPLLAIDLQAHAIVEYSIQNGEGQTKTIGSQELRSYLRSFGYLNVDGGLRNSSTLNNSLEYDDDDDDKDLEAALKMYQKIYHLNVTGKLDSNTINLINTPTCGFPDHNLINGESQSRGVRIGSFHLLFKLGVKKWPPTKYHLTYKINGGAQANVGNYALLQALNYGFRLWSKVSKFTFQLVVSSSPADLLISFQRRNHGDEDPFEGARGALAHAYPPMDGRMHVNADYNWSFRPPSSNDQFDLIWVVTHEIGHLVGIDHSENIDAVMYAHVTGGQTRRALHNDDIAAIQAMYSQP